MFGRSSSSNALPNFSSSSVLPIALAAAPIWRMSSCSRRKHLIMEPSNTSVNYGCQLLLSSPSAPAPAPAPASLLCLCSAARWSADQSDSSVEDLTLTLQISANLTPLHHCNTTSIISTLNVCTYSSSTSAIPDSVETLAILRAVSCRTRSGWASSSFKRILASDYFVSPVIALPSALAV